MREMYAERLTVLLEGARTKLPGVLEISSVEAGLQTVGWLKNGMSAEQAAAEAERRGVETIPLGRSAAGRARKDGLVLGFAAVDVRELGRGVEQLAQALKV
jgi:GntR family transcriptional regulator/MocR family aminotransferase